MNDPQLQIRNRINRIAKAKRRRVSAGPQVRAQDIHIPEKEKPGFFAIFLITCVFLLFVATVGMMLVRDGGFDLSSIMASDEVVVQEQERPSTNVEVTPPVIPQRDDKMEARVSELERDMRVFEHRVWLLGLATNENANMSKKMDTAHHRVDDRGFVTFDKDWKLSRVPETMQLTEEQRQRIANGPPK
jgi:hypothetical protein